MTAANTTPRRPRARSGALALATASLSVTLMAPTELRADAALQRDADSLQRCLEPQLAPWQIESSVSTAGRMTDTVRMTRWGAVPDSGCHAQLGRTGEACALPQGLQRVVRLDLQAGEPHPAWSANDRARIEDLIASALAGLAGDVRLRPAVAGDAGEHGETLRIRIGYRGLPTLQRDLAEWIRGPRGLSVTMTLVDADRGDRVLARREISLRQGPQWSDPAAATSGARWMTQLVETVDATAKTLLAPLACATPWLEVTADRGRIWLSDAPYTGLKEGRPMLLVPTAEAGSATRWPIARVKTFSQGGRAELEVVSGARDACDAGCRAVPL